MMKPREINKAVSSNKVVVATKGQLQFRVSFARTTKGILYLKSAAGRWYRDPTDVWITK